MNIELFIVSSYYKESFLDTQVFTDEDKALAHHGKNVEDLAHHTEASKPMVLSSGAVASYRRGVKNYYLSDGTFAVIKRA